MCFAIAAIFQSPSAPDMSMPSILPDACIVAVLSVWSWVCCATSLPDMPIVNATNVAE